MDTEKKSNDAPFKIIGNWENQSKNLKAKFPCLTDGDLKFELGKENEMIQCLESRLYETRKEVISIIEKNRLETAQL